MLTLSKLFEDIKIKDNKLIAALNKIINIELASKASTGQQFCCASLPLGSLAIRL
ncbi:MAG: hypothetical protein COA63_000715 [Methylophaga sp.]|nr:hypothetical protein [Methylophaga sp.]